MLPTSGTKSSEFKGMVMAAVIVLANGTVYVDVPWDTINLLAMAFLGYAGLRTGVKAIAHSKMEKPDA